MRVVNTSYEGVEVVRKKPINFSESDQLLFSNEWQRRIPGTDIIFIEDVNVTHNLNFYKNTQRLGFAADHSVSSKKMSLEIIWRLLFSKRIRVVKAIWIIDCWSKGYFHWITEVLPRLFIARKVVDESEGLIVPLPESFRDTLFVQESLKIFHAEPIYFSRNQLLEIKYLTYITPIFPSGNFHPQLTIDLRENIVRHFSKGHQIAGKRIYISRRKAGYRKIVNEEKVITILADYHFETVNLEDYSFSDQVKLFMNTSWIISIHGAGLTNMIFMPYSSNLLELRKESDKHNNCYFSLASALRLNYFYLKCKSAEPDHHNANLTVDLDKLKQFLLEFIK